MHFGLNFSSLNGLKLSLPRPGSWTWFPLLGLPLLLLLTQGCASTYTAVAPSHTHQEKKDTSLGDPEDYTYKLQEQTNKYSYKVYKSPLCPELVHIQEITKKRPRGFLFAVAEMPLYGLGLVDWVLAHAIAQESEQTNKTWKEPTGRVIQCGAKQPAPRQKILLQLPRREEQLVQRTDKEGLLHLHSCLQNYSGEGQVNLFVIFGEDIKYLSTIYF
ncbi:MAG: hypothetical protein ACLFOA_08240 [Desulfohalobiaceae bacterium]